MHTLSRVQHHRREGNAAERGGRARDHPLLYKPLAFVAGPHYMAISSQGTPSESEKEPSFELKVAARQPIEGVRTLRSIPAAQSYFDLEDAQKESARVTRRSHGIRLLFRQQGVLGTWDSMALAYFLLQSCTFLGVAWTLTELLCSMAPLLCGALRWPTPVWYDCLQPATDVPTEPKKKMQ
ncbi:unnamed protein product [Symbiodinium sp. KB8]|nr:unnamed protein product [Symbiodinium sp. KB8]